MFILNILNHFLVIKLDLKKNDTKKALFSFTTNQEKRIKECLISIEQDETVGPRPGILLYKNNKIR